MGLSDSKAPHCAPVAELLPYPLHNDSELLLRAILVEGDLCSAHSFEPSLSR